MKNPLIPMGAITGNPSRDEIDIMLHRYLAQGITQFLMYPRDGCEAEYMSERWLEICRDFIEIAAELGMTIWLYDEFNFPSGTCFGAVLEGHPEYIASSMKVVDGQVQIVEGDLDWLIKPTRYADILNSDVVDLFISRTHEVYYANFGKYFGNTIQGIFTDEPAFCYHTWGNDTIYPYTKDLEKLYDQRYHGDLFEEVKHPTADFNCRFFELVGELLRKNYIEKISAWCQEHGIWLTGHLMDESNTHLSVLSNGDIIKALRCFGLPGMDEIFTYTGIHNAEWITLGVVQAAIREKNCGGLVETFALGPTDITPQRMEQMLWLESMFGVDHYVLAVAAADASGNLRRSTYFSPMNYATPSFSAFGALGISAAKAASFASKQILPEVWVRYPLSLAYGHASDAGKDLIHDRLYSLLGRLVQEQYQWQLLGAEDPIPEKGLVIEITDREDWCVDQVLSNIKAQLPRTFHVLEGDSLADELLVRKYTDGSVVLLDLQDTGCQRSLVVVHGDAHTPLVLDGRGHHIWGEPHPKDEIIARVDPELRFSLDRPNTLRCNFTAEKNTFHFHVQERLDDVRLIVRRYAYDGDIVLDGIVYPLTQAVTGLTHGILELYRMTEPFSLTAGDHVISQSIAAKSEPFLPSCFVCGEFAADCQDVLRKLPKVVHTGALSDTIPQFAGMITLEQMLTIPSQPCALCFDGSELYNRVYANGVFIGGQYRGYRYEIPRPLLGQEVLIRIEQFTTLGPLFGRKEDVVGEKKGKWFPGKYERCGIADIRFVRT